MTKAKKPKICDNAFVKTLTTKNAHLINTDAGSSKVLDDKRIRHEIFKRKLVSAKNFKKAQKSFNSGNSDIARKYMADSLLFGAKSYWWSENTPYQEELHNYIHLIARWNHDNLGCFLEYENGKYVHRCMIAYTHKRLGVSPGMYGDKICSLCDEDLSLCIHKANRAYWIQGGEKNSKGMCRICLAKKCKHNAKHIYLTRVIAQIKNPILEEVSLVKYPVQPEMRMIHEFTYTTQEMMKRTNYKLVVGDKLYCHLCRDPCPGFDEVAFE